MTSKIGKYKPHKIALAKSLQFYPLAEFMMRGTVPMLMGLGFVSSVSWFIPTILRTAPDANEVIFLDVLPGLYTFAIGLFWFAVNLLSNFTAENKKGEDLVWPKWLCWPLSILTIHWFRWPALTIMSLPMYLSVPTQIGGLCVLSCAICYLIASIRLEKWKFVTGIRTNKFTVLF